MGWVESRGSRVESRSGDQRFQAAKSRFDRVGQTSPPATITAAANGPLNPRAPTANLPIDTPSKNPSRLLVTFSTCWRSDSTTECTDSNREVKRQLAVHFDRGAKWPVSLARLRRGGSRSSRRAADSRLCLASLRRVREFERRVHLSKLANRIGDWGWGLGTWLMADRRRTACRGRG